MITDFNELQERMDWEDSDIAAMITQFVQDDEPGAEELMAYLNKRAEEQNEE